MVISTTMSKNAEKHRYKKTCDVEHAETLINNLRIEEANTFIAIKGYNADALSVHIESVCFESNKTK